MAAIDGAAVWHQAIAVKTPIAQRIGNALVFQFISYILCCPVAILIGE